MSSTAEFFIAIGGILFLALATDYIGKRTFLPRVTLLLVFGIIIGNQFLDLIPQTITNRFEIISEMALLMIGFLLGGKLSFKMISSDGKQLLWISIVATLGTAFIVCLILIAFKVSVELAILLGCIAAATAPAATFDVVQESKKNNCFSNLLLAIVAIDDAWALLLFSLGLAFVAFSNGSNDILLPLNGAIYEIVGALILGIVIGIPAAFITGRMTPGQPILTEALALVFLCGGLAFWLDVSYLIAAMTMGAVIANFAKHHDYPFHEIENIEWPFMALFFILAGASLEINMLSEIGLIAAVYLVARIIGKIVSAGFGARLCHADKDVKSWIGIALLPQAGVAIGMALIASNKFPELQQSILSVVITTTIIFELLGPLATRYALKKTG